MTTILSKKRSHQEEQVHPVCLKQPQEKLKIKTKTIGPFILISLIAGLMILLPQGEENVIPPIISEESRYSYATSLVQTKDGGFALAGITRGTTGITRDIWLVKTDANGHSEWNNTFGYDDGEYAPSMIQAADGGYALTALSRWTPTGIWNSLFIKTDANGVAQWYQTYGEGGAPTLVQTTDGGFALTGPHPTYSGHDKWLVKTDVNGVVQWNQTYGEADHDGVTSIIKTMDGGYALVGTASFDGDEWEMMLVKTDSNGNVQWNQTYGEADYVGATSIVETTDGGYAFVGTTSSFGSSESDMLLVKTNASGIAQWNQTYGGTGNDRAEALVSTTDGGFALAGTTTSFDAGSYDMWLVKTDVNGVVQWNQTYGGTGDDRASTLIQTSEGGFALAGHTNSFGNFEFGNFEFGEMWLVKTDAKGVVQWNQSYNEPDHERMMLTLNATTTTIHEVPDPNYTTLTRLAVIVVVGVLIFGILVVGVLTLKMIILLW